jgi:hypothetical protein
MRDENSGMKVGVIDCLIEMRSRGSTHRHRGLIDSSTRPGSGRHREHVSAPFSVPELDRESAEAARHKS